MIRAVVSPPRCHPTGQHQPILTRRAARRVTNWSSLLHVDNRCLSLLWPMATRKRNIVRVSKVFIWAENTFLNHPRIDHRCCEWTPSKNSLRVIRSQPRRPNRPNWNHPLEASKFYKMFEKWSKIKQFTINIHSTSDNENLFGYSDSHWSSTNKRHGLNSFETTFGVTLLRVCLPASYDERKHRLVGLFSRTRDYWWYLYKLIGYREFKSLDEYDLFIALLRWKGQQYQWHFLSLLSIRLINISTMLVCIDWTWLETTQERARRFYVVFNCILT